MWRNEKRHSELKEQCEQGLKACKCTSTLKSMLWSGAERGFQWRGAPQGSIAGQAWKKRADWRCLKDQQGSAVS